MKKLTAIVLALLLILSLFGCRKAAEDDEPLIEFEHEPSSKSDVATDVTDDPPSVESDISTETVVEPITDSSTSDTKAEAKGEGAGSYVEDESGSILETGDHKTDGEYRIEGAVTSDNGFIPGSEPGAVGNTQIQSGTLTAGEWRDTDNLVFWAALFEREEITRIVENRNINTKNVVAVNVKDSNGNPCFNAKIDLKDANNNVIYSAVSDISGRAYLYYNLNNDDKDLPKYVAFGNKQVEIVQKGIANVTDLIIDKTSETVKELDLMLMIDTTGSMGDELEYLKKELDSVIGEVSRGNTALSINVSVNFYRDEGDTYEVKEFNFTDDIAKAVAQLGEQRADGGGDYPEAVHKALNSIVNNHKWRENSVKLCFLVLDAPPHSESRIQSINSNMQKYVETMAKQGIRIIPVASSGVDKETEFLCRSWAMMTGGTYTFLTDHSGVGGGHIEPTIGQYKVEKLNALMIRLIKEYCGIK